MEFWLKDDNSNEKLRLPIPPAVFEMGTGLNNTTVNVNDLGEINLIGKRKLNSISFDTFFPNPNNEYGFCQYTGFPEPYECVELVEKWRDNGNPTRLIITGTNINMACSIEEFKYKTQDGTGDIYFNLSLKEYRYINVEEEVVKTDTSTAEITKTLKVTKSTKNVPKKLNKRPVTKIVPKTYIVSRQGESLVNISKKIYGTDEKALEIAAANGMRATYTAIDGITQISIVKKVLELGTVLELP